MTLAISRDYSPPWGRAVGVPPEQGDCQSIAAHKVWHLGVVDTRLLDVNGIGCLACDFPRPGHSAETGAHIPPEPLAHWSTCAENSPEAGQAVGTGARLRSIAPGAHLGSIAPGAHLGSIAAGARLHSIVTGARLGRIAGGARLRSIASGARLCSIAAGARLCSIVAGARLGSIAPAARLGGTPDPLAHCSPCAKNSPETGQAAGTGTAPRHGSRSPFNSKGESGVCSE